MSTRSDQTVEGQGGLVGILLRLFWVAAGNLVLVMSSVSILQHKGTAFRVADVVFWITVPALVLARYLDIRLCDGQTAMGAPATMTHWRRYSLMLVVICAAAWGLCHTADYLLANR